MASGYSALHEIFEVHCMITQFARECSVNIQVPSKVVLGVIGYI